MRKVEYLRKANARVARGEAECHATILRAADKFRRVLQREITELVIRMDREKRGIRRRK